MTVDSADLGKVLQQPGPVLGLLSLVPLLIQILKVKPADTAPSLEELPGDCLLLLSRAETNGVSQASES